MATPVGKAELVNDRARKGLRGRDHRRVFLTHEEQVPLGWSSALSREVSLGSVYPGAPAGTRGRIHAIAARPHNRIVAARYQRGLCGISSAPSALDWSRRQPGAWEIPASTRYRAREVPRHGKPPLVAGTWYSLLASTRLLRPVLLARKTVARNSPRCPGSLHRGSHRSWCGI